MARRRPAKPNIPRVIEELLDDLFTNGQGESADRLVLTAADGRDLGGWSRAVVRAKLLDTVGDTIERFVSDLYRAT